MSRVTNNAEKPPSDTQATNLLSVQETDLQDKKDIYLLDKETLYCLLRQMEQNM